MLIFKIINGYPLTNVYIHIMQILIENENKNTTEE